MKKIILAAMLFSGLAGQSAFAAIHTFDFTASVSGLVTPGNGNAASAGGVASGTVVKLNDTISGQFSFDDQGYDWAGNKPAVKLSVTDFQFTFDASNTTVDVGAALWGHHPSAANQSTFTVAGASLSQGVTSAVFSLYSPRKSFSWELDSDTSAALTLAWARPGAIVGLSANLTSLTAVSPVPEPSTYAMLLLGAAVVGGAAKRRAARRAA